VALIRTDVSEDRIASIINLSEAPLEEAAVSALSKGLNYAVTPGHMPVKDIICGVERQYEPCLLNLPRRSDRRPLGFSKAPAFPRTIYLLLNVRLSVP
jgi:hypothetical protein